MKRLHSIAAFLAAVTSLATAGNAGPALVKEKEIILDGEGGFDLATVDPAGDRLYVAHGNGIDVIDLKKLESAGRVDGIEGARGVAVVPDLKRGFAAAGKKNRLVVFDLETLKPGKEVETGEGPDVVLYVSSAKEVWSFNHKGEGVTCVDAESLEVKAKIKLEGMPELAVEDIETGMVYVNLEDKNSVCAIDIKKHQPMAPHPLSPGDGPTGIALDSKNGLLFAGCGNGKLVAVDIATWKVVTSVEIGDHCDGVVFDPVTQNIFASCTGKTSVAHQKDAKTLEALKALDTPKSKTCAMDPASHRLFVITGPGRKDAGKTSVLVFGPSGGAQAGPLGDLSAFTKIANDTLALATSGDLAGAKTKIKDLETAWDDAEKKMKPMSPSDWTSVDKAIDEALSTLRAGKPDKAKCVTALKDLVAKLEKEEMAK